MGKNPSFYTGDSSRPVEEVSATEAMEFCARLNIRQGSKIPKGYVFRLPTEAEWEFACRSGTTTKFSFGDSDDELKKHAWYVLKPVWFDKFFGIGQVANPQPVGQKKPNTWGLYDMHGNVCEWCLNCSFYLASNSSLVDPIGESPYKRRVHRGGSYRGSSNKCRSAYRYDNSPDGGDICVGFRVAIAPMHLVRRRQQTDINSDLVKSTSYKPKGANAKFDKNNKSNVRIIKPKDNESKFVPLGDLPNTAKKLQLIKIPPGSFSMGSPKEEIEITGKTFEGPQTEVTISKLFWMGKHEITQAQYQVVMGNNPSNFKGDSDLPVEQVSWPEVMEFCSKLNVELESMLPAGYVFRLPTEAEWEYACRAGTTTIFSYGDFLYSSELCKFANYCDSNSTYDWADKNANDGFAHTAPVGSLKPNPWGLHDMHGNVWEWCLDWYLNFYRGGSAIDPTGPNSGNFLVYRGGSWSDSAEHCRSASRSAGNKDHRIFCVGFRIVLAPALPESEE